MDEATYGTLQENDNLTIHFIKTLLVALCSNFNPQNIPGNDWECQFRSDYHYQLKSLKGKTLKFTTLQVPPLSGTIADETGLIRGDGIAFDIIHEIQRRVGFHYNITLPKENTFGNEKQGVMKLLNNQEVDMAVAFIPIFQAYHQYASFSSELTELNWILMMARPSASASASGLLAPFQATVWMFILLSLIIAGPTMYLIVYLRSKFCGVQVETTKKYNLSSCIWFVYGALMKQGSTMSPVSDSPRLFFATWWIFITILTSFYTANLTAFLTLSEFTLKIQTPEDIYENNRKWMADAGGYIDSLVSHEDNFYLLKKTSKTNGQFVETTLDEKLQSILKGIIYISEKSKAEYYMYQDYMNKTDNNVPEKKRCAYVITPKAISKKTVAFGYTKNSTLKFLLDPLLTYFVHSGIIQHLLNKNLPLTTVCPLNLADRERKLKNEDLHTTYKIVAVGFASSIIAFVGEVLNRFFKKRLPNADPKENINSNFKNVKNNNWRSFENRKNELQFQNSLHGDFSFSKYYRDIIMPYNIPYRYDNFTYIHEGNAKQLISNNQQENLLFQFTH